MKKSFIAFAGLALIATACNKENASIAPDSTEIVISVSSDLDVNVETKATAIADVPASLYLQRTTGSGAGETNKNASASVTVSSISGLSGKISTGWQMPATATAYNYYLSNKAINFVAGASTLAVADNSTDVLAGVTSGDDTVTPAVALDHIFARTGTLTALAPSGYTITGVTWEIESNAGAGTAGTYNMVSKAWSGTTALAKQTLLDDSDLYLVPGSYKIYLTYTLIKGDWTKSTTKSADVTLVGGKINNLKIGTDGIVPLIDGGATDIVISVTLNPWGSTDISVPLS